MIEYLTDTIYDIFIIIFYVFAVRKIIETLEMRRVEHDEKLKRYLVVCAAKFDDESKAEFRASMLAAHGSKEAYLCALRTKHESRAKSQVSFCFLCSL